MPDHLHSIATFPPGRAMARVVGDWKRYQEHRLGIRWQQNFFDHRLRNEDEFAEKITYIRMNPVRKELCSHLEDWPWNIEPWKRSS